MLFGFGVGLRVESPHPWKKQRPGAACSVDSGGGFGAVATTKGRLVLEALRL